MISHHSIQLNSYFAHVSAERIAQQVMQICGLNRVTSKSPHLGINFTIGIMNVVLTCIDVLSVAMPNTPLFREYTLLVAFEIKDCIIDMMVATSSNHSVCKSLLLTFISRISNQVRSIGNTYIKKSISPIMKKQLLFYAAKFITTSLSLVLTNQILCVALYLLINYILVKLNDKIGKLLSQHKIIDRIFEWDAGRRIRDGFIVLSESLLKRRPIGQTSHEINERPSVTSLVR